MATSTVILPSEIICKVWRIALVAAADVYIFVVWLVLPL
jgi:hypothetical protein